MSASPATKVLTYRFRWQDGREREFAVRLSLPSLSLQAPQRSALPEWTRLEFHQCANCPLKAAESPRCPVAVSMADLVELFKDCLSTEITEATIITDERQFQKTIPVQDGISSLMGLYMATGGCPILDKLRPMTLIHLPFSGLKETVYRSLSMYLTAQFLRQKRGLRPDWELKRIKPILDEIFQVNRHFIKRLLAVASQDASLNALAKLDCLAGYTLFSIQRDHIEELEAAFSPYFKEP